MQMFAYAASCFCAYVYVGFLIVCNFICKNKLSVEQQAVPRFGLFLIDPHICGNYLCYPVFYRLWLSFIKNKIHSLIFRPVIGG